MGCYVFQLQFFGTISIPHLLMRDWTVMPSCISQRFLGILFCIFPFLPYILCLVCYGHASCTHPLVLLFFVLLFVECLVYFYTDRIIIFYHYSKLGTSWTARGNWTLWWQKHCQETILPGWKYSLIFKEICKI